MRLDHICMPRIGCGYDGLEWSQVKDCIQGTVMRKADLPIRSSRLHSIACFTPLPTLFWCSNAPFSRRSSSDFAVRPTPRSTKSDEYRHASRYFGVEMPSGVITIMRNILPQMRFETATFQTPFRLSLKLRWSVRRRSVRRKL